MMCDYLWCSDQLKPAVLPPVTSSSPVTLPAIESKNGGSGQSGGLVPRLASEEILSQLNEIGQSTLFEIKTVSIRLIGFMIDPAV